jgi:hypothetical protein
VRDRECQARRICRVVGVAGELFQHLPMLDPPRPCLLEELRLLLLLATGKHQ